MSIKQVNEKLNEPELIDGDKVNSDNILEEMPNKETSPKSVKSDEILKKLNKILETLS